MVSSVGSLACYLSGLPAGWIRLIGCNGRFLHGRRVKFRWNLLTGIEDIGIVH
ncbi:MAG: hypothetical protein KDI43_09430 [Gammaproteobacteria bacterium]|nr:hypothetical protein [Gammaproteobacteria bacterium]